MRKKNQVSDNSARIWKQRQEKKRITKERAKVASFRVMFVVLGICLISVRIFKIHKSYDG